MSFKETMTFEEVDSALSYDPETGKLWWRVKTAKKVMVGMEAGCVKTTRTDPKTGEKVQYRYVSVNGNSVPAARIAWLLHYGSWPASKILFDDGNPLNLKAENLRMANTVSTVHDYKDEGGRADYMREYRSSFPMDWKDSHLRSKFGISLADYSRMVVEQENKCAICGKEETEMRGGNLKALAVDHDHATGAIRGLLCVACNTGLGKLGDSRETLLAAIKYLDKHAGAESRKPELTLVSTEGGDS